MFQRIIHSRIGKPIIFLAGLTVSGFCLYLAFQKLQWNEFWHSLKTIGPWAVILALIVENFVNLLLAKRWAALLKPLGEVSFWTAFWSLRISYFFNATLPARLGEPFRIYYINRKSKISATKAIGAMGADRFVDFTSMLILIYVSVIVLGFRGTLPRTRVIVAAIVLLSVTILALKKLPKHSRYRWLDYVLKLRANIFEGMTPLLSWRSMATAVPISFICWIIHALMIVGFSYALGAPISLFKAFMVIAGVNIAIAIPSSPGHIGTFELGAITTLRYFKVPIEEAACIAILYHMVQLIPTLVTGAYGYYFHFLKLPRKKVQSVDPMSLAIDLEESVVESESKKVMCR